MTQLVIDKILMYLTVQEGFTDLSSPKTSSRTHLTVADSFGFVYQIDLSLISRLKSSENEGSQLKFLEEPVDKNTGSKQGA